MSETTSFLILTLLLAVVFGGSAVSSVWVLRYFRKMKEEDASPPKPQAEASTAEDAPEPLMDPGIRTITALERVIERSDPNEKIAVIERSGPKVAWGCGHQHETAFRVSIFGDARSPSERTLKELKECPDCMLLSLKAHSIRCALCGGIILPGQGVASYQGGDIRRKDVASKTPDGSSIGCLRMDCCPSGGFFSGHWTGKAYQPVFDARNAMEQAILSGQPVIATCTDLPPEKK